MQQRRHPAGSGKGGKFAPGQVARHVSGPPKGMARAARTAPPGFGPLVGPGEWREAEWSDGLHPRLADPDEYLSLAFDRDRPGLSQAIVLTGHGAHCAAVCSVWPAEDGDGWAWTAMDLSSRWLGNRKRASGKAPTVGQARESAALHAPAACSAEWLYDNRG